MPSSTFSVNVHELDDGPKELSGPLPQGWLAHILRDTDVQPTGDNDGQLHLLLTKNGSDVLVQGRLQVTVSLPCARTLDPAVYQLRPDVFLMLTPAAGGRAPGRHKSADRKRHKEHERGHSGKAPGKKGGWDSDPELSTEEAAQDTYSGDQIVLDGFLREFILLELPMVPLREDLRDVPFEANPPLPTASESEEHPGERPLDPRLSRLRELKARLEKKE